MNNLVKLTKMVSGKILVKDAFNETEYNFEWNTPAEQSAIENFEEETGFLIPDYYKEFLLCSNGGIIYKSSDEDDGYELLGIEEIKEYTEELNEAGYDIPKGCFIFLRCAFSADILLFDANKDSNYILDGDAGYSSNRWEYIKGDFNNFFGRLVLCNGAMFWRW